MQVSEDTSSAPVMAGMFLTNGYPITILFDSGASHTFISTACVVRNNLEFDHTEDEYHVKSLGGRIVTNQLVRDIVTNQLVRDIALDIEENIYLASPLILLHQGIDIILGVDWMKQYEVVLDTLAKTVSLTTLNSTRYVTLQLANHQIP